MKRKDGRSTHYFSVEKGTIKGYSLPQFEMGGDYADLFFEHSNQQ